MPFSVLIALSLVHAVSSLNPSPLRGLSKDSIGQYSKEDSALKASLFQNFKSKYKKTYSSHSEEYFRFQQFSNFLTIVDQRNQAAGAMVHGISQFADLSQAEFESCYLGLSSLLSLAELVQARSTKSPARHKLRQLNNININWQELGYTTPIKDQGQCGSCWAFSATEQIETDTIRLTGRRYILAPQQIVSCDIYGIDSGCGGGNDEGAFYYVENSGGMVQESSYPYTSGLTRLSGVCNSTASETNKVVTLTDYVSIWGEANIAAYVSTTGPVTIYADASKWNSYTASSGVWTTSECPATNTINHAIQIVGLVIPGLVSECTTKRRTCYWIIRNQWGTMWGNDGYIFLEYGMNTCNLFEYSAFYIIPQLVGVVTSSSPSVSEIPSTTPSSAPNTLSPTNKPSNAPSAKPSKFPTTRPSVKPTTNPTVKPSAEPSRSPTLKPTTQPTVTRSKCPSVFPTFKPSVAPTSRPSAVPNLFPTPKPTGAPTIRPSKQPTFIPTFKPSVSPTIQPSKVPTISPTPISSGTATVKPSVRLSFGPAYSNEVSNGKAYVRRQ